MPFFFFPILCAFPFFSFSFPFPCFIFSFRLFLLFISFGAYENSPWWAKISIYFQFLNCLIFPQINQNFSRTSFMRLNIFCTPSHAHLFLSDKGSYCVFLTRNNCCEFLASYGVIIQSVIQSFLKVPVCGYVSCNVTEQKLRSNIFENPQQSKG